MASKKSRKETKLTRTIVISDSTDVSCDNFSPAKGKDVDVVSQSLKQHTRLGFEAASLTLRDLLSKDPGTKLRLAEEYDDTHAFIGKHGRLYDEIFAMSSGVKNHIEATDTIPLKISDLSEKVYDLQTSLFKYFFFQSEKFNRWNVSLKAKEGELKQKEEDLLKIMKLEFADWD